MAFGPVFGRTFQSTFDRRNAAGAWWNLFGAIPLANCVAAYQPKGAASLAASYINLVTPGTYNAAPGTAPTWDATNGWKFDQVSAAQYLTTGIVATNSLSAVIRYTGLTAKSVALFGAEETAGSKVRFNIYARYGGPANRYFRAGGNYNEAYPIDAAAGVAGVTPAKAYWNGSPVGDLTGAWTGTTAYTVYIAHNYQGATPLQLTCCVVNIQAFAIYNIPLTVAQNAALYTAITAL